MRQKNGMSFLSGWVVFLLLILQVPVFSADQPKKLNTITFRIRAEPESLDWNKAHTLVEAYLLMNLMEGLVTFDQKLNVVPALAESWKVSPDGKTYTFQLRSNVKWSDGVVLKADDFVFSWRRLLSPLTGASYAYYLFDVEGAEDFNKGKILDFNKVGIKALNPTTLEVKLKSPVPYWTSLLTFWVTFPLRKDIVEQYSSSWDSPGRMVSIGPFVLQSHEFESHFVLKANPYYYGRHGNLDQVIARIIKDDQEAMAQYEAGKIDFLTDLTQGLTSSLSQRKDLFKFAHFTTGFLGFVTNKYPTSDVKFRRAVAMGIDRSKISSFTYGAQVSAHSFVPPGMIGYSGSIGLPFNPSQAKADLKAMGFEPGVPIQVDYIMPDWDKSKAMAEFIKKELKTNLGMDVDLHPLENKAYRMQLDLQGYPLYDLSWTADYPDPDNFLSLFLSESGNSMSAWKSKSFDQSVQQARLMQNKKQRESVYIELQKIIQEKEVILLPLYYEPNLAFIHSRVKNFELNPLDYLYLRNVNVIP
ncbi:peptide ABC transporter substrate-binding protein [bacterium]|nr:peptide ABC transporter substrate-binding protein [bacterium]